MIKDFRIQIVEDNAKHLESLTDLLEQKGYSIIQAKSAEQALQQLEAGESCNLAIIDVKLPGMNGLELFKIYRTRFPQVSAIIYTGNAEIESAVDTVRLGAVDYLEKGDKADNLLLVVRKEYERQLFEKENLLLTDALDRKSKEFIERYRLIGKSKAMTNVLQRIKEYAAHDATVLITGESGTGKENAAQLIHYYSSRRDKPFIKINVAAMPRELIESELFGHVKGAFSGAISTRTGCFELANGATLFLDEVGEIPVGLQVKLLNVLQDRKITKVGSNDAIESDFRLIVATNHNLEDDVESGKFRLDLYYRIKVFELKMPSLQDHLEDMDLLAAHFVKKFSQQYNKYVEGFSPEAIVELMKMAWPGNVRQLEHLVECLVLDTKNPIIDSDRLFSPLNPSSNSSSIFLGTSLKIDEVMKELMKHCLRLTDGNKSKAAELMGIKRPTLYAMIRRYKIS